MTSNKNKYIDGEYTKHIGEHNWTNPHKYMVKVRFIPVASFAFLSIGIFIGILLGNPSFRLTGFVTTIILGVVLYGFMYGFAELEQEYFMKISNARKEEIQLLKIKKDIEKLQKRNNKPNYLFTSADFDESAQSLLLNHIIKARKSSSKVTGQGLIEIILKGIR